METNISKSYKALQIIQATKDVDTLINEIKHKTFDAENHIRFPIETGVSDEGAANCKKFLLEQVGSDMGFLTGEKNILDLKRFEGHIENYIGVSMVPTGVIGPVKVIGTAAKGDFYVPMATTEGALLASYHRGARSCYLSGGATSICLEEGVQRSPLFKFCNIAELGEFVIWVMGQYEKFREIVSENSRYAKLVDMKINIEGNHLILLFEYHTGDAAGQNMVTFCTDEICKYIIGNVSVQPQYWFVEGNFSGDKKATAHSFLNVRGKKVTAEIAIGEQVVLDVLKTTSEKIAQYWESSTIGIIQSGSIGAQGHYANGLAAIFIATGQDVACVSEASIGVTRMEHQKDGSLYACITMPNLIVGTIGGGTGLPTQKECLALMDCVGEGKARKFAEICAAVILAGEISIAAALSAGHFTSAHRKFGRKKS